MFREIDILRDDVAQNVGYVAGIGVLNYVLGTAISELEQAAHLSYGLYNHLRGREEGLTNGPDDDELRETIESDIDDYANLTLTLAVVIQSIHQALQDRKWLGCGEPECEDCRSATEALGIQLGPPREDKAPEEEE